MIVHFWMSYFVLSSAVGIHVFADTNLVLLNESTESESFVGSMNLLSSFEYSDPVHGAVIQFKIEKKCIFIY